MLTYWSAGAAIGEVDAAGADVDLPGVLRAAG